jgi:F-type H+-transporting ATPase subunit a
MSCKRLFSLILLVFSLSVVTNNVCGQEAGNEAKAVENEATHEAEGKKSINFTELVFGHISDSHEWHFFDLNGKAIAIPLPIILYTPSGIKMFSAAEFEHWHEADGKKISNSHEGYHIEKEMKEKVIADDGSDLLDISPTKNVVSMLISIVLLFWIMMTVAKKYKTAGAGKAPTGLQNAVESAIIFIRDEVATPNLGKKSAGYMPLLLTLFFFIWINNLLGLLPGGANFTGNIAVTLCLSGISFLVMVVRANKHFWGHLLNPPGVPFGVKLLLVPIEIISMFVKPVALTIRLFANILAGHIVILCVVSLIFIFAGMSTIGGYAFAPVSMAFSIFLFCLELLVAAIQAFIFTNLTAVFIGQAIDDGHHEHHHDDAHDSGHKEVIA